MTKIDPHRCLGLHNNGSLIRLLRLGLKEVYFELKGKREKIYPGSVEGIFEYTLLEKITFLDYRIYHPNGKLGYDPYAFLPTFSREDEQLFAKGEHWKIYEVMGGRLCIHQGCEGVKFAIWAPCAQSVALVGDFNGWDVDRNPMRQMGSSGVWEIFIPGLMEGEKYKFAIFTSKGECLYKADPFAFQGEMRPLTASVICRIDHFKWDDQKWIEHRKGLDHPLNIYEVHLGSWKKRGSDFLNYREIAPLLADYVKKMGYTHIELMPVMEHALDESWGYQVTGFYAISSRYGSIEAFQYFVNHMHSKGIGVIIDWVPGHFPRDAHALAQFDGTYLYEHLDPRQGYHLHWHTHIFNYGRYEVLNFLIGSALFYLDKMHVDGFRVDAVSSMLYLDFGKKEGEWIPNCEGNNINLEALHFLQKLNRVIHDKYPQVLMIAEESHAYPGTTDPQGLGFDLKWNLGWMHDTLDCFALPLQERCAMRKMLMHESTYYFQARHLLPFSHDEVVHEKKSLLAKMPGNEWEKFANLRLLYSYMICHPGKKLLFMGGELGQWGEWNCKEELHWEVLKMVLNQQLQHFVAKINHFYIRHGALWENDFSQRGWQWINKEDGMESVLVYLRKGKKEQLLCIHHLLNRELNNYLVPYRGTKWAKELFSTDLQEYGGCGIKNNKIIIEENGLRLTLPPLSTLIIWV